MKIFINDQEMEIARGMTVKHVLIQAGLLAEIRASKKAFDEWGNEVGLDGALSAGMKLYVKGEGDPGQPISDQRGFAK